MMGQVDDSIRNQNVDSVFIDRHFSWHYQNNLQKIKRVYPIALAAKSIIDSLDKELENIDKNRLQKKHIRSTQRELEDEFTYLLKDLYIDEGVLLLKLIHRETGMTVDEILRKYRGNLKAGLVKTTFLLFGHNTESRFEPNGDDWITELVLKDIESGKIQIDLTLREVDKQAFKDGMKEYRNGVKEMKKQNRKSRKKARKKSRS